MNEGIAEPRAKALLCEDLSGLSSSFSGDEDEQEMTGESLGVRGIQRGLWGQA